MHHNIGNIVKKGKSIMTRLLYDSDDAESPLPRVRGNCLKSIIKLGDNVS
jgi:L-cysteine desulfidase